MPDVTAATVMGWVIIGLVFYILGEYTSVLSKVSYPVKWFKGGPARQTTLGLGGFFGGVYAGGILWSAAASFIGASALAGGTVFLGLTAKETLIVFLAALVVGLALYTGAAAEEAVDAD